MPHHKGGWIFNFWKSKILGTPRAGKATEEGGMGRDLC